MRTFFARFLLGAFVLTCCYSVPAQDENIDGLAKSVAQIFYGIRIAAPKTNLTANLSLSDTSKQTKRRSVMPGRFWMTDKAMVWQIEATGMSDVDAASKAMLVRLRLDQIRVLVMFETEKAYVIYPKAKAYIETKVAEGVSHPRHRDAKRNEDTREMLHNGHPCTRVQYTFDDQRVITLWHAKDLADFPIRVQTDDKEKTTDTSFTMVDLGSLSEPMMKLPDGYKAFNTIAELSLHQRQISGLK